MKQGNPPQTSPRLSQTEVHLHTYTTNNFAMAFSPMKSLYVFAYNHLHQFHQLQLSFLIQTLFGGKWTLAKTRKKL